MIKRTCGFYVNSMHLITMILPYIRKQLEDKINIDTFFDYNLNENMEKVLSSLTLKKEIKQEILDINWSNSKIQKFSTIERKLKKLLEKNKELNILISGRGKYIKEINEILNKFLDKNFNNLKNKYITIINCYEVTEFNDNIREILDLHDFILNTSGIHNIEEVFEGYSKTSKELLNKKG